MGFFITFLVESNHHVILGPAYVPCKPTHSFLTHCGVVFRDSYDFCIIGIPRDFVCMFQVPYRCLIMPDSELF